MRTEAEQPKGLSPDNREPSEHHSKGPADASDNKLSIGSLDLLKEGSSVRSSGEPTKLAFADKLFRSATSDSLGGGAVGIKSPSDIGKSLSDAAGIADPDSRWQAFRNADDQVIRAVQQAYKDGGNPAVKELREKIDGKISGTTGILIIPSDNQTFDIRHVRNAQPNEVGYKLNGMGNRWVDVADARLDIPLVDPKEVDMPGKTGNSTEKPLGTKENTGVTTLASDTKIGADWDAALQSGNWSKVNSEIGARADSILANHPGASPQEIKGLIQDLEKGINDKPSMGGPMLEYQTPDRNHPYGAINITHMRAENQNEKRLSDQDIEARGGYLGKDSMTGLPQRFVPVSADSRLLVDPGRIAKELKGDLASFNGQISEDFAQRLSTLTDHFGDRGPDALKTIERSINDGLKSDGYSVKLGYRDRQPGLHGNTVVETSVSVFKHGQQTPFVYYPGGHDTVRGLREYQPILAPYGVSLKHKN